MFSMTFFVSQEGQWPPNICLQGKSFQISPFTDYFLNAFTGECVPKEFVSSNQVVLFHLEAFQLFHPCCTFPSHLQLSKMLREGGKKRAFTLSIISKVRDPGEAIRTGHLQQSIEFFNKGKGGTLPFPEISCQHSFSSFQLLQLSFRAKAKPFSLPILFHCLRLYLQKSAAKHPSQRCH